MISASVPTGGIVMAKDGTPAVLKVSFVLYIGCCVV